MKVMANALHFIKHVQLKNIEVQRSQAITNSAGIENHFVFPFSWSLFLENFHLAINFPLAFTTQLTQKCPNSMMQK